MFILKWDDKENKYFPYVIPDDWHISVIEKDMDYIVNCVNCGKEIRFGDGYTSMRYHTYAGYGYIECESCRNQYLKTILKKY